MSLPYILFCGVRKLFAGIELMSGSSQLKSTISLPNISDSWAAEIAYSLFEASLDSTSYMAGFMFPADLLFFAVAFELL